MNLTVLHSSDYSPNEMNFLYPLHKYRKSLLSDYNLRVNFTKSLSHIESDCLILSSKWFSGLWSTKGPDYIFKLLLDLRGVTDRIIWSDISDSTGTTHFMVLPYVDLYLKNQVFIDKANYYKKYHGSRIYCDYINKVFRANDRISSNEKDLSEDHLNFFPDKELLFKIQCGWNSGLAYFGRFRTLQSYLFKKYPDSLRFFRNHWVSPFSKKDLSCSCRIGVSYPQSTIALSRKMIKQKLEHLIPVNKISAGEYYTELKQSVSAVTPFGLGEISLRDFEVVLNGAAMIKQDMSHIETWPNLWVNNESYLPFKWDLTDLIEQVEYAITNPDNMRLLAHNAQVLYRSILDSSMSLQLFCERLVSIIGHNVSHE